MNNIPNDMIKTIIQLIPSIYYYNIYRLNKNFRNCLKFVYDQNVLLRKNPKDILSAIVYGYEYITGREIYQALLHDSAYLGLIVHYDIKYEKHILDSIVYRSDLALIKHIEKLNDLTPYYTSLLRRLMIYDNVLFNYLFEKILKIDNASDISTITNILIKNRIDLVEQLINTKLVTKDVLTILIRLIDQNYVELVNKLLSYNKLKLKRYQTLYNHCESLEMRQILDSHYNRSVQLKKDCRRK